MYYIPPFQRNKIACTIFLHLRGTEMFVSQDKGDIEWRHTTIKVIDNL